MNIEELEVPRELAARFEQGGATLLHLFRVNAVLQVLVGRNHADGSLTLSMSHPRRRPTWEEVWEVRMNLLDQEKCFAWVVKPEVMTPNWVHLSELLVAGEEPDGQKLIVLPGGRI